MVYSLVDFAKSVKLDQCKIRNTPNKIFLCGGRTANSGPYLSARDYFYRHLKSKAKEIAKRVTLAEVINDWFFRSTAFPDLLELENYLADLADITVLFVESPGSIAELGAFAASDVLRPKTLAVLNKHYDLTKTFIAEGPVQKIKNEDSDLIHYYEWDPFKLNTPAPKKEFSDLADGITSFLKERDKLRTKEQSFNIQKHGHALLLVADLIAMAGVVINSEIAGSLKEIGCEYSKEQLDRYFSLLESMALIKRVLRSNQAFYITCLDKPFLHYAYKPGVALRDEKRIKAVLRSGLDPMRKKILAQSLRKPIKKEMDNG